MRIGVKRILYLRDQCGLSDVQSFDRLGDLAAADGVDCVMADLPPEYLSRFHDWIDNLPPLDTLINVKSGPLSDRVESTIRAIGDWLDCHAGGPESTEGAGLAAIGSGATDPTPPIVSRH